MQPEGRRAIAKQRVVKRLERKRFPLLLLVVLPQLHEHELPDAVDEIRGIERAAFGLPARASLLHEGLIAKKPHALLDRQVFGVQPDTDDETSEADERL